MQGSNGSSNGVVPADAYVDLYQLLEFNVIKAAPDTKRPSGKWANRRNQLPNAAQWEGVRKHAEAGKPLFLITGDPSKTVVLDLDTAHAIQLWQDRLGESWDDIPRARTPSDHYHLYFFADEPVRSISRFRKSEGWELKANGAGVVLPSGNGDRHWEVQPDDLPEFNVYLKPHLPANDQHGTDDDWEPLDIEAIFAGVERGERDERAYKYACSLRSREVKKPEALQLMRDAWELMEQDESDPFTLEDAENKIHRVWNEKPAGKSKAFTKRKSALVVETADLANARPHSWIWHHRIVQGYLNLLLGEEEVGKSTLVAWVLAGLTRGEMQGCMNGTPCHVAILGDEDDFDNDWTPRLHAAGADLNLVHVIKRPDFGYVELADDHDKIASAMGEFDIRVLYLDQLLDNLGVKTDDWRGKQVREALIPARSMARELKLAVWASMHPNKHGNSFRELMAGAAAFNAVGKSNFLLARHPDDPTRRVYARGKGNLCPEPLAIEFDIVGYKIRTERGLLEGPMVDNESMEYSNLTKADLIGEQKPTRDYKIDRAKKLILTMMPNDDTKTEHLVRPILDAGEEQDLGYDVMNRARNKLGLLAGKTEEIHPQATWRWPITIRQRA